MSAFFVPKHAGADMRFSCGVLIYGTEDNYAYDKEKPEKFIAWYGKISISHGGVSLQVPGVMPIPLNASLFDESEQ